MSTEHNRAIVTRVMDALAEGDGRPFADAMAENFTWRMIGTTAWSGDYRGKDEVRGKLMKALFGQFATQYRNRASNILADGDCVVVECRGEVTTKAGKAYNNEYCYVIRMADGRMTELREYMDTALVNDALDPPAFAQ